MIKAIGLIVVLFLSSCASSDYVLNPSKTPKANQPVGYKPVGVVKYLNQGADSIIESRREDAFKKMAESCPNGKYKINSESEKPDNSAVLIPSGNMLMAAGSNYWYINYECVE